MTWFSEYSASPRRSLAKSAIRCPSVDRFAGFSVPSRVSGQRFSLRGAHLLSAGSRRARFPDLTNTMRALRLPARAFPVPYGFGSRLHMLPRVRDRRSAPGVAEDRVRAWALWSAGLPRSGNLHVDTHGISQVSWRSILYLCPALRPRPDRTGPRHLRSGRCCPRAQHAEGSSMDMISGLNPGLWYPLPTLHEWRCRRPCKARFRLAGCAFAGRVSNPLERGERFQVLAILLSRTSPDASWVHAERLVHKLDTFNDAHREAQTRVRDLIWTFYADLKAYQGKPGKRQARAFRTFAAHPPAQNLPTHTFAPLTNAQRTCPISVQYTGVDLV